MKKKIAIGFLLFLVLLGWAGYGFREPIWEKAGQFMAPQGDYKADVVILEGTDYIPTGLMEAGLALIACGKVKKIIVVVHQIAPAHRLFGMNGDYADIVRRKLRDTGLKEEQFKILAVPKRHPITLTEAQFVLKALEPEKIASAILVALSYHTRRSYMAYAHVAQPLAIKIYPLACFPEGHLEKWWEDQGSFRDFGTESLKMLYYLAFGHIPFKFSY